MLIDEKAKTGFIDFSFDFLPLLTTAGFFWLKL
jgi:hypothetical protein